MQNYNVTATSEASPAVVWRLLLDARSWPVWSAADSLDTERSTGLDPEGRDAIGAVRAFRTGWMVTGERLTGYGSPMCSARWTPPPASSRHQ